MGTYRTGEESPILPFAKKITVILETSQLSEVVTDMINHAVNDTQEELRVGMMSTAEQNGDNKESTFIAPVLNDSISKYLDARSVEQLEKERGDQQEISKGQLTQEIYELIRENSLNPKTLIAYADSGSRGNIESKCNALKQRYIVDDTKTVRDKRRDSKVICEPARIFDIVACAHLINNGMTYKPLYKNLNETYANITRDYVQMVVRCCSSIRARNMATSNAKSAISENNQIVENIYQNLAPLERVHVEIIQPFDDALLGGKYSHVLYWRDYRSRYVWLLPLKNKKFKTLMKTITNFLLNIPRVPLFIESCTIDKQDLFDIFSDVCKSYHLTIGLGSNNSVQFQLNGIEDLKQRLNKNKSSCISDWNMCIWHGSYAYNRAYNAWSRGVPNDQLWTSVRQSEKTLEIKQKRILKDSSIHNLVRIGWGVIYLEDDNAPKLKDEEQEYRDESHSDKTLEKNQEIRELLYDESQVISEPSTSFYEDISSPSKKRRQISDVKEADVSLVL